MNEELCRQIGHGEWKKGDYRTIATIKYTMEEMSKKCKFIVEDEEEDGLGNIRQAAFVTLSNRQFVLVQYADAIEPRNKETDIMSLNDESIMTQDLESIMQVLDLTTLDLTWISPKISFSKYELWRQDDNGIKYLVNVFLAKLMLLVLCVPLSLFIINKLIGFHFILSHSSSVHIFIVTYLGEKPWTSSPSF